MDKKGFTLNCDSCGKVYPLTDFFRNRKDEVEITVGETYFRDMQVDVKCPCGNDISFDL